MRTDVVVLRGSRRGRRGYIYGGLTNLHPLATKTWFFFGKNAVLMPVADLALADEAVAEPQLNLFKEGAPNDAADDTTRLSRRG